MKTTVLYVTLVLAIAALFVGGFALWKPILTTPLGSVAGPDINGPYFAVNNLVFWPIRLTLKQATTTPCALKSPSATSTLIAGGINFAVSSSTAITVVAAESATAFSTTTLINSQSVAGPSGDLNAASTTISALVVSNDIFPPNSFLVFSETGGITAGDATGAGFVPKGSCFAEWAQS